MACSQDVAMCQLRDCRSVVEVHCWLELGMLTVSPEDVHRQKFNTNNNCVTVYCRPVSSICLHTEVLQSTKQAQRNAAKLLNLT
jgi:hypothetical protein